MILKAVWQSTVAGDLILNNQGEISQAQALNDSPVQIIVLCYQKDNTVLVYIGSHVQRNTDRYTPYTIKKKTQKNTDQGFTGSGY